MEVTQLYWYKPYRYIWKVTLLIKCFWTPADGPRSPYLNISVIKLMQGQSVFYTFVEKWHWTRILGLYWISNLEILWMEELLFHRWWFKTQLDRMIKKSREALQWSIVNLFHLSIHIQELIRNIRIKINLIHFFAFHHLIVNQNWICISFQTIFF